MRIPANKAVCQKCGGTGYIEVTLGFDLRKLRMKSPRGMSLTETAAAIGLSLPYLSDVERGHRPVTARVERAYRRLFMGEVTE